MPIPPPGYTWSVHPQYGLVLMPLPASQPQMPPPMRQPQGVVPYPAGAPQFAGAPAQAAQRQPGRVIQFPDTCALVKKGNRDTYAELLAGLPDLAPPSGYDAMAGQPAPETQAELAGLPEFAQSMSDAPPVAYPRAGRGVPMAVAAELKPGGAPAPGGDDGTGQGAA